jgi:DNA anti-recombination protein RmuC
MSAHMLRKFSEAFGTEVAAELVDWANQLDSSLGDEIKERGEQYYLRFDARLEQRFAEANARMDQLFAQANARMDQLFAQVNARLEQRLAETKAELRAEIGGLRNEMHAGFASLRAEMALQRSDMIKWMFTFWAGSAVTTVATVWGLVSLLK